MRSKTVCYIMRIPECSKQWQNYRSQQHQNLFCEFHLENSEILPKGMLKQAKLQPNYCTVMLKTIIDTCTESCNY